MPVTVEEFMHLTLVLVLLRVILNSAEALSSPGEYTVRRLVAQPIRQPVETAVDFGISKLGYLLLTFSQLASALILLVPSVRLMTMPLLMWILASEFCLGVPSRSLGGEGSDQMHRIVLCAITLYYSTPEPLARSAVVWFIALQSMLAYFTSGAIKLRSRPWRLGTAINSVLSTDSYGSRWLHGWIERVSRVSKLMCWGVIALECGFPLAILAGPKPALIMLCCGAFFHLMIAMVMGLNGFFWSFVATYPAVFLFSRDCHTLLRALWG